MSKVKVEVEMLKDLPIKELDRYIDYTVYNIARTTLDYTAPHIPYLSGNMERAIASYGVRGSNKEYTLGDNITDYSLYVWNYPQSSTNWTNPRSYSKWFITEFKNRKELIVQNAVNNAKRGLGL
jgi:hypothetical protein